MQTPTLKNQLSTTSAKHHAPWVSVIIPAYQAEAFIADALDSVLRQTFDAFEVIIVNDGSTDRTAEVIADFSDPRIRVLHQDNRGLSQARNRGVAEARGEYIAFLDADDMWFPEKLQADLETIAAYPIHPCLVIGGHYTVDEQKQLVNIPRMTTHVDDPFEALFGSATVLPSTLFMHREVLAQVGGFPESRQRFLEDRAFYARVYPHFPVYATGKRMVLYRQSLAGLSLGILQDYQTALHVAEATLNSLREELPQEKFEHVRQCQTRCLLNLFLRFDYFDSAKRYASHVPVSLLVNDVKGWLSILSLILNKNILRGAQTTLEFTLKVGLRPWWFWKRRSLFTTSHLKRAYTHSQHNIYQPT